MLIPEPKPVPKDRDWLKVASLNSVEIFPPNSIKNIKKIVAAFYKCTQIDLNGPRRLREFIIPRHVAMYFCRHYTGRSLPEIGRAFGGRDHATVLNGVRSITKKMQFDENLQRAIGEIRSFVEDEIRKWNAKRVEEKIVFW
jgi:chromosomal replication initiation ATPase DnaA